MLWALATPVMADNVLARRHFDLGITAFEKGRFQIAINEFEAARRKGLNTDTLWYNLGVAYYRQGQFRQAEVAFSRLLRGSNRDLARYNLGLVALAADQPEMAEAYFLDVYSHAESTKLKTLASRQLDRLEPSRYFDEPKIWSASLGLNTGYDSNLALVDDGKPSFEGAAFLESLLAGAVQVAGEKRDGVRIDGVLYSRQYFSNGEYDTDYTQLGLARSLTLGQGVANFRLNGSQSWLDSHPLEREVELGASYRLDECTLMASSVSCEVALSAARVDGGPGFEAYDGQRFGTSVELDGYWQGWQVSGRYRYTLNRRRDFQTTTEFYSVSPVHHELVVAGWHSLTTAFSVGTRLEYRFSRYRDKHILMASDGVLSERRLDHRSRGAIMLEYRLSSRWTVSGEWDSQYNESSLARYDYSRQVIQVGVDGRF